MEIIDAPQNTRSALRSKSASRLSVLSPTTLAFGDSTNPQAACVKRASGTNPESHLSAMKTFFLKHLLFICICLMVCSAPNAATITVGPNQAVTSIVAAIKMTTDGDTIYVEKAVYKEGNIIIDKQITLIGIDRPILDGEKKHEIISVGAPNVIIKGFWLKDSGNSAVKDIAAIKVYEGSNDVEISENMIEDSFFAIYFQGVKRGIAYGNEIHGSGGHELLTGNAIHAWKCDSLHIEGNTISGHRDGIYLEFVTKTEVRDNITTDNMRYGLHFMFSHDNGYYHNTFSRNGAGVAVMYTRNVRMEYNVFDENWGDSSYGLLLKDITDSHIENNTFNQNTTGILMEGSNRVHIEYNTFKSNGWALKIQASCMDNTILQNNFISNTFDVATNGSLTLNKFERNYWDKYEGYDLDKDHIGDVPYRPVSLFSMLVERHPMVMLLFRSFMATLLDRTERVLPSLTPEGLKDDHPSMKPIQRSTEITMNINRLTADNIIYKKIEIC